MRKNFPLIFIGVTVLSCVFVWYAVFNEKRSGILEVYFLDVGQGDAIFIEAPNGRQVLLDAGQGNRVVRALGEVMPFYDRSIDILIATHPDADHIGVFIEVLRRYETGAVFESGVLTDTALYHSFKSEIEGRGARNILGKSGDRIVLDKKRGVYLEILFPDRDVSGMEANAGSLVSKLVYGDICFVLTGDSPTAIEEYLALIYGLELDCEVLKVGHHGSNTSSSPLFVAAVSPAYAVISVGRDNRYGHPRPEVLDILSQAGAEILRTDELGTIVFETDGTTLRLK